MKIQIAYFPEEAEAVSATIERIVEQHPGIRVKRPDSPGEIKHAYLTTQRPQKG